MFYVFLCDLSNNFVIFVLQSIVMLVFREEKSPEDEIKAWQFWHSRQHSVKQRILDAGESKYISQDKQKNLTTLLRLVEWQYKVYSQVAK